MFEKRHYEVIARLLRAQYVLQPTLVTEQGVGVVDRIVEEFASLFSDHNPRFKRKKFMTAAGYVD